MLHSLPPEGFGGAVNILDVCEGPVHQALMDPGSCVLSEEELPKVIPRPRVRVKRGDCGGFGPGFIRERYFGPDF